MKRLQIKENWDEIRPLLDASFAPVSATIRSSENFSIEFVIKDRGLLFKLSLWRVNINGSVEIYDLQTKEAITIATFKWDEIIFFDKILRGGKRARILDYFLLVKNGLQVGDPDLILKVRKSGYWVIRDMNHVDFMTHLRHIQELEEQEWRIK
jgi:hypothetical protein